jgi:dephospho-CoA kinase
VIWGVTGCIGAGKSTATLMLEQLGARVLDLDRVSAWAVTQSSLGITPARALETVVTNGPDRARTETVLIPIVERRVAQWCAESTAPGVLDAALLFEQGLERFCDFTVCVCCPIGERRRRVLLRPTASAALFDAIEASQWPEARKAQRAQLCVWDGEALRQAWLARFPLRPTPGRP